MLEEHPMIYREFGSAARNAMEEYVEKMNAHYKENGAYIK